MEGFCSTDIPWQEVPEAGAREHETAVTAGVKTGRWNDQQIGVSRTEYTSRPIWDYQLLEVLWCLSMQGLVGEGEEFKDDTLSHWEPVQRAQYRSDVITFARAGDNPGSSILDPLYSLLMVATGKPYSNKLQ